jgi:hypothetical protein
VTAAAAHSLTDPLAPESGAVSARIVPPLTVTTDQRFRCVYWKARIEYAQAKVDLRQADIGSQSVVTLVIVASEYWSE